VRLNLSFLRKSIIAGATLGLVGGLAVAFNSHANAQNDQITTHGAGYELHLSADQGKIFKVSDTNPNRFPCAGKATTTCRCNGENSDIHDTFCQCLKDNQAFCTYCSKTDPDDCWTCPTNHMMGAPCKFTDGDNDDQNGSSAPITTQPSVSQPSSGGITTDNAGQTQQPPTSDNNSGNTTGMDSNPSSDPGCTTTSGPRPMGVACRAPGGNPSDPQPCGYRQICTVQ